MSSRTFTIDELEELEVRHEGTDAVRYFERVDSGRWSEYFTVVFEYEGKHYLVHTEEGLTEMQMDGMSTEDHYPDHSYTEQTVECPEVELYTEQVPVTKWRKVA